MASMTLPSLEDASLAEAQAAFLAVAAPVDVVRLPLLEAFGAALAGAISAPFPLPPFDNSAMDGYALRAADVAAATAERPVSLRITGVVVAGPRRLERLGPGEAAGVMTGAVLPAGADTVLPQEEAAERDGCLVVTAPVVAGRHVRRRGEDLADGAAALPEGTTLGSSHLALLAALGCADVQVVRRPRVAVLTTGDELVMPGERREGGQIYNANLFALCAQIQEAGAQPYPLPPTVDRPDAIRQALDVALGADVVVTSGGMCGGQRDYVAEALAERGLFVTGCLRLRPARHVGLGVIAGKPVFALPGNPAAGLIAFELLARPALRRMAGHRQWRRPNIPVTLSEAVHSAVGVTHALWVRIEHAGGGYSARLAGRQGAGMVAAAAGADGLLLVPEAVACYEAGATVTIQLLTGVAPV